MKVRKGFVSNSSSSSFVIAKEKLSPLQIRLIECHSEGLSNLEALAFGVETESIDLNKLPWEKDDEYGGSWEIQVTDDHVMGWTSMDNYSIHELLMAIGITTDMIDEWEDDGHGLPKPWAPDENPWGAK